MKTGAKVGIGCLVALAVLVAALVVGGIWWVNSPTGAGWIRRVHTLKAGAESLKSLNRQYAFTPPADGRVTETRLKDYLAICKELKPKLAPDEQWLRAHQNQQGDLKDAKKGIDIVSHAMVEFAGALKSKKMSPAEFTWIQDQMQDAAREAAKAVSSPLQKRIAELKAQLQYKGLTAAQRGDLEQKLDQAQKESKQQPASELSHNAVLYQKYQGELNASDLGYFTGMLLRGQSDGNVSWGTREKD
ncbi:MAG: hypothetical protein P8Z49_04580 [Acidobacteriota bacterium]|jgi:hypothetical protein